MSFPPDYSEYSNEALLEEMETFSGRTTEAGHLQADAILKEALRRASRDDVDPEWADDLLDAYNEVGKWYA